MVGSQGNNWSHSQYIYAIRQQSGIPLRRGGSDFRYRGRNVLVNRSRRHDSFDSIFGKDAIFICFNYLLQLIPKPLLQSSLYPAGMTSTAYFLFLYQAYHFEDCETAQIPNLALPTHQNSASPASR